MMTTKFPFLKSATSNGKIFSVVFKKTDGSYRYMICRTGVKKGVKGV